MPNQVTDLENLTGAINTYHRMLNDREQVFITDSHNIGSAGLYTVAEYIKGHFSDSVQFDYNGAFNFLNTKLEALQSRYSLKLQGKHTRPRKEVHNV